MSESASKDNMQELYKRSSLALLRAKKRMKADDDPTFLEGARRILDFMYNAWQDQKCCDLVIKADGGDINAHSVAFGAHSETLTSSFYGYTSGEVINLDLSDFRREVVLTIIHFLYTTELDLNCHIIGQVLSCATKLGMDLVVHMCMDYLRRVDLDNTVLHYSIAENNNLKELRDEILRYFLSNFSGVAKSKHFVYLPLERLVFILKHPGLYVDSEVDVFRAVVRWVDQDRQARIQHSTELLQCVRFQLMTAEVLASEVETADWIFVNQELWRDCLYKAMKYNALNSPTDSLQMMGGSPRSRYNKPTKSASSHKMAGDSRAGAEERTTAVQMENCHGKDLTRPGTNAGVRPSCSTHQRSVPHLQVVPSSHCEAKSSQPQQVKSSHQLQQQPSCKQLQSRTSLHDRKQQQLTSSQQQLPHGSVSQVSQNQQLSQQLSEPQQLTQQQLCNQMCQQQLSQSHLMQQQRSKHQLTQQNSVQQLQQRQSQLQAQANQQPAVPQNQLSKQQLQQQRSSQQLRQRSSAAAGAGQQLSGFVPIPGSSRPSPSQTAANNGGSTNGGNSASRTSQIGAHTRGQAHATAARHGQMLNNLSGNAASTSTYPSNEPQYPAGRHNQMCQPEEGFLYPAFSQGHLSYQSEFGMRISDFPDAMSEVTFEAELDQFSNDYVMADNSYTQRNFPSSSRSQSGEMYETFQDAMMSPPDMIQASPQSYTRQTEFPDFNVDDQMMYRSQYNSSITPTEIANPGGKVTVVAVGGIDLRAETKDFPGRVMCCVEGGEMGVGAGAVWKVVPSKLPASVHHHGVAVVNNKIYVIGGAVYKSGESLGEATANVSVYDAAEGRWQNGTPLPEPRAYLGAAVWRQQLFAVCGENSSKVKLDTVISYDIEKGVWKKLTKVLGGARVGPAVAVYQDGLFVVGGYNKDIDRTGGVLADVAFYDLLYNSWILLNPLTVPRCHSALVSMGSSLLLVGGRTRLKDKSISSLASILEYDVNTDGWVERASMQQGRHDIGCTAIGSLLYIAGGIRSPKPECLTSVECYNIETGKWLPNLPSYPYPAAGLGLATVTSERPSGASRSRPASRQASAVSLRRRA